MIALSDVVGTPDTILCQFPHLPLGTFPKSVCGNHFFNARFNKHLAANKFKFLMPLTEDSFIKIVVTKKLDFSSLNESKDGFANVKNFFFSELTFVAGSCY